MIPAKATVTHPTAGVIDHDHLFIVVAGVYDVEQVDEEDVYLITDEIVDGCVIVTRKALGLVECPGCNGRGDYSYRVSEDEWESDWCAACEGLGGVTEEFAADLVDAENRAREQLEAL